jgi:hypothetical protein
VIEQQQHIYLHDFCQAGYDTDECTVAAGLTTRVPAPLAQVIQNCLSAEIRMQCTCTGKLQRTRMVTQLWAFQLRQLIRTRTEHTNMAGPRHVGAPGRVIIWRTLKPTFFKIFRPTTGLEKFLRACAQIGENFRKKIFRVWKYEFTNTIYDHSLPGIAGSNPVWSMDVCLLRVLCVVGYRPLRWTDHSSRGVLPRVVRLSVITKPEK